MMIEYVCPACAMTHGTVAEATECCAEKSCDVIYFCGSCEFEAEDRKAAYAHKCETGVLS